MPFDWHQVLRDEAARLLAMSLKPGCKEYAEDRLKKMADAPSCASFRDELKQMRRQQSTPLSTPPDGDPCEQN